MFFAPARPPPQAFLFNVQEVPLPKRSWILFSEQFLYLFRFYRAGRVTVTDFLGDICLDDPWWGWVTR